MYREDSSKEGVVSTVGGAASHTTLCRPTGW